MTGREYDHYYAHGSNIMDMPITVFACCIRDAPEGVGEYTLRYSRRVQPSYSLKGWSPEGPFIPDPKKRGLEEPKSSGRPTILSPRF